MSVRLYLGVPGSGKTQGILDFILADFSNLFLTVDRALDYAAKDKWGNPNPRWRGAPPRLWTAPSPSFPRAQLLHALAEARELGGLVRFGYPWEALEVAQVAAELGDCVLVDDELDFTATYRAWETNPIRAVIHRGRHLPDAHGVIREVHLLGACRRPQSLHIDVPTLADEVSLYKLQGEETIARCIREGWLTDELATKAQTFSAQRGEPFYEFIVWRSDGTRQLGRQTNPFFP
jgi:hypothetical protein